jgi:hypothetical protein
MDREADVAIAVAAAIAAMCMPGRTIASRAQTVSENSNQHHEGEVPAVGYIRKYSMGAREPNSGCEILYAEVFDPVRM